MSTIHEEKYKGCTIRFEPDFDAESPRDWNNLGEILYTSTRYKLGDKRVNSDYIQEITERSDVIFLPVYAFIHSGVRLSTTPFSCPWDSGQCGIIWTTLDKAHQECGNITVEQIRRTLQSEVTAFAQYLAGEAAGYVVQDPEGEEIDSCWGFYPDEDKHVYTLALLQAKAAIDHWAKEREAEAEQHNNLL